MIPFQRMEIEGITDEELITHWEAYEHLSRAISAVKLKQIPNGVREKIGKFYVKCRKDGYYPSRPSEGKMLWNKIESYQQGMEMLKRKAFGAPKSLAAMEPESSLEESLS